MQNNRYSCFYNSFVTLMTTEVFNWLDNVALKKLQKFNLPVTREKMTRSSKMLVPFFRELQE